MCMLIYGGFRESELVKLKLIDIRLEDKFINVIGKGNYILICQEISFAQMLCIMQDIQ